MPSATETNLHIKQTDAFIAYDPVDLVFQRKTLVDDGAGGKRVSGESAVSAQRVRVVGFRRPPTRIIDGLETVVDRAVVGRPDLDVRLGDTFTFGGYEYEIINIQDRPLWRMTAEARRRG